MMNKKAQSEVIAVLLILAVTVGAVAVAYRWAMPKVQESQDKARIDAIINFMEELDRKIREVSNSGEGSQRFIELEFDKGQFLIHPPPDNNIVYQLVSYTITSRELPLSKNLPYGSYLRVRRNEEKNLIEIILEYSDIELEAEVPGSSELVLPPKTYNIFIRNMGGGVVRISRRAAYIGSTERFLLSGYVYDNTGNELSPLTSEANGDYIKADGLEVIPNAEILVLDPQGNIVTSTRANSYGKYALLLQRRITSTTGQYYFVVNKTSYVMKEWDTVENVKCDKYTKDFDTANTGGWEFDVAPYKERDEIRIDFPLYKIEPPDVLENVPIAIIVDHTDLNNEGIIYDIRDALDNDPETHCLTFIVYGNVPSVQEAIGPAGSFKYPGTDEPIDVYPIEWLLDPDQAQDVTSYGWGDADLNSRFNLVASIGGAKDKIDYHDFSLIIIGTGAIQMDGLLDKLKTYRDTFTNFVSLGKFTLNGIEYARSLIVFPQIKGYGSYDPLLYYFDTTRVRVPPSPGPYLDGVDVTDATMADMQNDGEVDENFFLQDNTGHDDERYGNEDAYSWLPEFMGKDLRLTYFTGVTDSNGVSTATLTSFGTPQDVILSATALGASVERSIEFFRRISLETRYATIGANGVDTTLITATVRDENGAMMDGVDVTFSTDAGTFSESGTATCTVATTDGIATATLVSGTSATTANVRCELTSDNTVYDTVTVDFATGLIFRLTAEDDNGDDHFNEDGDFFDYKIEADGLTHAKFTATVVSSELSSPITGQKIYFYTDYGTLSSDTGLADANGNCEVTLTSDTQPRKNTVTAEIKLYDDGEAIYKDNGDGVVSVGDIRLTPVNGYDANSVVADGDSDIGDELTEFNFYEKHIDDVNGTANAYDYGETIYRDVDDNGEVSAGDYRITSYGSYPAGSTVNAPDDDIGLSLISFNTDEKFVNTTVNYIETVEISFVGPHAYIVLSSSPSKIPLTRLDPPLPEAAKITATVYDSQGTAIPSYIEDVELTFTTTLGHFPYSEDKNSDPTDGWQINTDNEGKAEVFLFSYNDDNDAIDGSTGEEAISGTATVYAEIPGNPKKHTSVDFVSGLCFPSCPSVFEISHSTSISTQVYDSNGDGIPGVKVTYSLNPPDAGSVVPDNTHKRYNFYEVHRGRGGGYGFAYVGFWWLGIDWEAIDTFDNNETILYDHNGASGAYDLTFSILGIYSRTRTFHYDNYNSRYTGYMGSKIFSGLTSNEMNLDVHGFFDLTNTGWDNSDVAMMENDLPRQINHWTETFLFITYSIEYIVYEIQGGPTMLIKENRDEYNNLVQSVIVTTIDFDRYGNNLGDHDGDGNPDETDGDLHTDVPEQKANAHLIEKNMILYAMGHEELI